MLRKYATTEILGAEMAPQDARGLRRMAHRHTFEYTPRPGYLYVRSRAISSRTNDNFDTFPAEEIKKAYMSFVGKPVFVNHNNDNHRRARGVVIDAALHEDKNPDGSPDTWAEVLMEVDAVRFPKLAEAIVKGHIDRTSMGTDVKFSKCSFCGNKASTPLEYCQHIPKLKGKRIYRTTASGHKEGVLVSEICYGLGFFENSLLVEEPADPTAFFLGVDDHSGMKVASKTEAGAGFQKQPFVEGHWADHDSEPGPDGKHRARCSCGHVGPPRDTAHEAYGDRLAHAMWDNPDYVPAEVHQRMLDAQTPKPSKPVGTIPQHMEHAETGTNPKNWALASTAKRLPSTKPVSRPIRPKQASEVYGHSIDLGSESHDFFRQMHEDGQRRSEMHEYGEQRTVNVSDHHDLHAHMTDHGYGEHDLYRNSHDEDHPALGHAGEDDRPLTHEEVRSLHDWEHGHGVQNTHPDYEGGIPGHFMGDSHFHTASLQVEAKERKKISEMSPDEVTAFRAHQQSGRDWHAKNPVHVDNVLAHWNAATDHERHTGMNWYSDAHELTKHVANDTGHPIHVAAGLMSNYSPQTHWATNMMNAAKAMRGRVGIGGKGSGVFATHSQRKAADRMMGTNGHSEEHYDSVLSGPKTHAFAHLIEHGGNADPNDPKVVIDRHALSVAAGKRCPDIAYEMSGLGGKKRYKEVADVYHAAAKHISKATGMKVEAHHVQAATWLARQRMNSIEDKKTASYAEIGRKATHAWNEYAGEHHPHAVGKEPGTGYAHPAPVDAPEDVLHAHELHAEGHHGGDEKQHGTSFGGHPLHTPVPLRYPRRRNRLMNRPQQGEEFSDTMHYNAKAVYAYGETMAPADVDTLRDEECPVCGEADAYDGNECMVCGFVAPPKMFQDPDLDLAKQMDLRKDTFDAQQADPNGDGMPDVIPGSGAPGPDNMPLDPSQVPDPQDVAQQQVNDITEAQQPLMPQMLDANGQPIDPDEMAMQEPQEQDPYAEPMAPEDVAGQPEPGTPGDADADLACPTCGFQAPASPPQSTDMGQTAPEAGFAAGAICPNCGQDFLQSLKQMNAGADAMGEQPMPVQRF